MTLKEKLDDILVNSLGVANTDTWWDSPNRALDMQTPRELFEYDAAMIVHYIQNQLHGKNSL